MEHTNQTSTERAILRYFSSCLGINASLRRERVAQPIVKGSVPVGYLWISNVKKIRKRSSHSITRVTGLSPSLTSLLCLHHHPPGLHPPFLSFPCKIDTTRLESLMFFRIKSFWAREEITTIWRQKCLEYGNISMSCPRNQCRSFRSWLQNDQKRRNNMTKKSSAMYSQFAAQLVPSEVHYHNIVETLSWGTIL